MKKRTLVLGASTNPNRYSNIAIRRLIDKEIEVVALGKRKGKVFNVIVDDEKKDYKNIDTVTIYLNPSNQVAYYKYIISLNPRRVIFNQGAESVEFIELLRVSNINVEIACTLVLLSTNQY